MQVSSIFTGWERLSLRSECFFESRASPRVLAASPTSGVHHGQMCLLYPALSSEQKAFAGAPQF